MDLTKLIIVALIGETLWETAKMVWQQGKINIDRVGVILISILLAILIGLDLFQLVGAPISVPLLGKILTGLLLSRGANFMHDIIGSINGVYSRTKKNNL